MLITEEKFIYSIEYMSVGIQWGWLNFSIQLVCSLIHAWRYWIFAYASGAPRAHLLTIQYNTIKITEKKFQSIILTHDLRPTKAHDSNLHLLSIFVVHHKWTTTVTVACSFSNSCKCTNTAIMHIPADNALLALLCLEGLQFYYLQKMWTFSTRLKSKIFVANE